ncbi:hypothetical protein BDB01DRAFT_778820 [Pilobolus umbonatus]|nr:hypothetical protein BDB01DRAFT_778820 [Pilobolus umbonatus]
MPIKKNRKPGRKPMERVFILPSDPVLKRKAQNRAAQRAFRERKENYMNELQGQLDELRNEKEKREKELLQENLKLKTENEKLKEENYVLRDARAVMGMGEYSNHDNVYALSNQPLSKDHTMSINSKGNGSVIQTSKFDAPPLSDLYPEKDVYDYHSNNEFLIQSDILPPIYEESMNLYGFEALSETYEDTFRGKCVPLHCAPENEKSCKQKISAILDRAKAFNRPLCEIRQDIIGYCPDFDLDQLCDELKRKIAINSNHVLTDEDVNLLIDCINRNS